MSTLFCLINNDGQFSSPMVQEQFSQGTTPKSSPEMSRIGAKLLIGIGDKSQTIVLGDIVLSCAGTIYNADDLYRYTNTTPTTSFNYEVIIHMYLRYGIEHTLQMLDGDFVFILVDNRVQLDSFKMYIARDPYGVRPLYILYPNKYNKNHIIGLATEMKMLKGFYHELTEDILRPDNAAPPRNLTLTSEFDKVTYDMVQFPPGTYSTYYLPSKVFSKWTLGQEFYRYHSTGFNSLMYHSSPQYHDAEIVLNIQRYLIRSVEKRCASTDLPMGCLLSGGLDSSVIAGLVKQFHVSHGLGDFETFSVGMEGCEDLKHAKMVADHLGSVHHELILKKEDFIKAIPEVIHTIETYDTLTVRTSIAHYLLGKFIAEHGKAKVIFTGDGADEIFGGHLYMYMASESIEFDCEVRRLLKNMHHYDLVRTHKCLSRHGLQSITPFMDRAFIQYYLSVAPQVRFHTRNDQCEKYFLRLAFSTEYYRNSIGRKIFPEEALWRTTEAFSDGISLVTNSLHDILHDYTNDQFIRSNIQHLSDLRHDTNIYSEISKRDPVLKYMNEHLVPVNVEQYVYRKEFEKTFAALGRVLPCFCMPKYAPQIYDPSPRSLKIYSDEPPTEDSVADEESDNEEATNNFTIVPPENFDGDFSQPITVCVNIVTSDGTSKIAEFTQNFNGVTPNLALMKEAVKTHLENKFALAAAQAALAAGQTPPSVVTTTSVTVENTQVPVAATVATNVPVPVTVPATVATNVPVATSAENTPVPVATTSNRRKKITVAHDAHTSVTNPTPIPAPEKKPRKNAKK